MEPSFDGNIVKRTNARKNYQKDVSFSAGAMILPGVIKDISLRGACIDSRETFKIKRGSEITIAIPFARKQGGLKRKAFVKWAGQDRFGVQFANRRTARRNYQQNIYFVAGSIIFQGVVNDISLKGASVHGRSKPTFKEGAEMVVTMPYVKKRGSVKRKAIVKWIADNRFGIQFV
jgi:hypothetical protein